MKVSKKNSLKSLNYATFITFIIVIYIDSVILSIFEYEKGENFYHYYYLTASALITSFSVLLNDEKYKDSIIIYLLNQVYKSVFIKNRIISLIIFGIVPILYISFI